MATRATRTRSGQSTSSPATSTASTASGGRAPPPTTSLVTPAVPVTATFGCSVTTPFTRRVATARPATGAPMGRNARYAASETSRASTLKSIARETRSVVPLTATVPDSGSSAAITARAGPRDGHEAPSTLTRSERSATLRGGETLASTIVGAPTTSSRPAVTTPSL